MAWRLRRSRRARLHLIDPPGGRLPSIDGLLVSARRREYLVAVPQLITGPDAEPVEPDCRLLAVPRERVAFVELR